MPSRTSPRRPSCRHNLEIMLNSIASFKGSVMLIGCKLCRRVVLERSPRCLYSTSNRSASPSLEASDLQPKFSDEQQQKILDTLNQSNAEQLARLNVSRGRIKNLESWRSRKGPFKSLSDVLEVDGLGEKVLERLYERIIVANVGVEAVEKKPPSQAKNRRSFVSPLLSSDKSNKLSSAVGIHFGPTCVSWAKLCRDGNSLANWNFYDFTASPKKMLPSDTFHLAVTVLNKMPVGEVYVFEASPSLNIQSPKQVSLVVSMSQQLELMSMLLALINTSQKHNTFLSGGAASSYENCVYHLKANLTARLFRTLVGSERVSSITTMKSLLENMQEDDAFVLPCTPVKMEPEMQEQYHYLSPILKELQGQALFLTMAFMDVCVYKNPISLAALSPRKKHN